MTDAGSPASPATRMFTTNRYPIYYLSIAKCGCTFLKNLFYALDHGAQHPAGNAVHAHEGDLVKASFSEADAIRKSDYSFTVLRDPVDRFLSFYFDKIYTEGPHNFPALRRRLADNRGLDLTPGLPVEAHRKNATILLGWVAEALKKHRKGDGYHHWKRQSTRLRVARALVLTRLTLDGLDQQLPDLLSPIIPDIAARMAGVTARNKAPRPVPQNEVADRKLSEAIDRVYERDRANYDAAAEFWAHRLATRRFPLARQVNGRESLQVVTERRSVLHYLPIALSGSTYLDTLFHTLDHEDATSHPPDDELIRRDMTAQKLTRSGAAFFVLRDPVERFFSLYFDVVRGTGPQALPWIARRLVRRGTFHCAPELSLDQHRQNCRRLLAFIEFHFRSVGEAKVNPFWRPQAVSAQKGWDFGMVPLLEDQLAQQLAQIAGAAIPEIDETIARIPKKSAPRPFASSEIATTQMRSRIDALYHRDREIYDEARGIWEKTGHPPKA